MLSINHWGTFDVVNYGDLLFPLILERELARRLGPIKFIISGPRGGPFPGDPARGVRRIARFDEADFFSQATEFDATVLGGGDIVRFDDAMLAGIYGTTSEEAAAERFYRLFVYDLGRLAQAAPVVWNAVGVPHEIARGDREEMRRAVACIRYLSVRDEASRKRLERAGVDREIHVAPDSGFLLPQLFAPEALDARLKALQDTGRFPHGGRVLSVQISFAADSVLERLAGALSELAAQHQDLQIVLLPIGLCHQDLDQLRRVKNLMRRPAFLADGDLTVTDIAAVIARSDYFAGSSLHGNITAFVQGVDSLFLQIPPYAPSKLSECARTIGREDCVIASAEEFLPRLQELVGGKRPVDERLCKTIQAQAASHFDRMAEAIAGANHMRQDVRLQQLDQSHRELWQLMAGRLAGEQGSFEQTRRLLAQTQASLTGSVAELRQTQASLEGATAELKEIKASAAWRALSRYGRIKHRYLLPFRRLLGRLFGRQLRPAARDSDAPTSVKPTGQNQLTQSRNR